MHARWSTRRKDKMHKAVAHLQDEFAGDAHRAGDAGARREAEGRRLRHRGPAAAARRASRVPEPRVLVISPYDKGAIKAIEKAIQASDLGVNPSNDGADHPPHVPRAHRGAAQGAGEGRASTRAEEGRVAVRNVRRHARQELEAAREGRRDLARTSSTGSRRTSRSAPTRSSPRSTSCSKHKEKELLEV